MARISARSVIPRRYTQAHRLREIVSIMVKYGLTDYVRVLRLDKGVTFARDILFKKKSQWLRQFGRWERVRMAMEELGPVFVKLGQLLSNRNDVLPEGLLREFERLQDNVPPVSAKSVRRVIEQEIGRPVEEVFSKFDWTPVASASIAQVHRARLQNGALVAVKVQRPGIEPMVQADLRNLRQLASLVERYIPSTRLLALTDVVDEFEAKIRIEMNFERELLYMQKFKSMFSHTKVTQVPAGYREFTTRRVLVMEFLRGERVTDIIADGEGYNKKLIAMRGATLVLEQVFIHGFFHADPHPGNVMILPGNVVSFLDFGMMGRIRPNEMESLRTMFLGMTNRDAAETARALIDLTEQIGPVDLGELEIRIFDLLDEYLELSLEDFDLSALFQDLLKMLRSFKIIVPANLILMMKALVSIQGIGVQLSPGFNLMQFFQPFARRLILQEFRPRRLAAEAYRAASDYRKLAAEFPSDLGRIMKELGEGRLGVHLKVQGLERLRITLEQVSFRIVHSAVLAALIIGSSLMLGMAVPPTWRGVSLFGVIGISLAAFMGLSSLISMLVRIFRR
ncbi:MAG: ABC1 kinase family protein [Spirochaetales bacterium]